MPLAPVQTMTRHTQISFPPVGQEQQVATERALRGAGENKRDAVEKEKGVAGSTAVLWEGLVGGEGKPRQMKAKEAGGEREEEAEKGGVSLTWMQQETKKLLE